LPPGALEKRRFLTRWRVIGIILVVVMLSALMLSTGCTSEFSAGDTKITVDEGTGGNAGGLSSSLQILLLLTALSLAPAALMMVTSFTRIIIVLSFMRNAISVPQMPPNQVLLGLALFLSIFIMAPVWRNVNSNALQPYLKGQITQQEAFNRGQQPLRDFMFRQTREKDISLFIYMAKVERPRTAADVPTWVLIPAFIISELKTAFQMGFVIFVPFLIIDLVVSSTLMSMGMMMLPPVIVSLPFKILLFVLVDGWHLLARSLVGSFG
jgi:flagellar biosynthesis protein FliP